MNRSLVKGSFAIEPLIEMLSNPSVALAEPKKYRVVLYNDDYTPMSFVILVLKRFFYMSESQGTRVMRQIHLQGSALCGIYTRDIAQTKVCLVNDFARSHEHPLLCSMEQE